MSERDIDELLRKSEELAESISSLHEEPVHGAADPVGEEVRQDNLEILGRAPAETPAYVSFSVTEDHMKAMGHFYPPVGSAEGLSMDAVTERLQERGISFGVDWEAVKEAVRRCNTDREEIHDVVVAKGRKPKSTVPAHIGLKKDLLRQGRQNRAARAEDEQIDYRSLSPFVIVGEGDVVARDIPESEGKNGSTVFGEEIPCATEERPRLKPGRNIRSEGGYYKADVDGRLEWGTDYFRVNQVLELKEGVDYKTGHIDFPGDVIIHKPVRDRFTVHAGGSVYCMETLDASEVVCGGDLVARRGIIGRNAGVVKVEGSVRAKYIENCYVEARGAVQVESGIVNSFVNSLDTVRTGKRGIVVGGRIYALHGLRAAQLGTSMGPKTEIYCGIDFTVSHRLKWVQDKSTEIAFQLQQVKTKLTQEPESRDRLLQAKQKLEEGLRKLQESAQQLVGKLDKDDTASVCATGDINTGVYIEISHVSYQVDRPRRKQCFKLDKRLGRVVPE